MEKFLISIISFFSLINLTHAQMLYDKAYMSEATFYFSDKPFTNSHVGAKTSFKSNEFIYGRLELAGKTLKEAFQLDNIKEGPLYLFYHVASYNKDNKQTGSTNSIWNALELKEDQLKNTWLNFDILPDPPKVTSRLGMVNERSIGEFDKVAPAPMYLIIKSENFPSNDEYTIYVQFYLQIRDGWGSRISDDKWPVAEGSFSFNFNSNDVAVLQKNSTAAQEKLNTVYLDKLPDYFIHPLKLSDPTVTVDKVTPLIKNYRKDLQILKVAVQPASSMWSIVKNDFGIVSYRYVTAYYGVVYKEGGKCKLGSARVQQNYISDGKYGNLYCEFWGDEGELDCGLLK